MHFFVPKHENFFIANFYLNYHMTRKHSPHDITPLEGTQAHFVVKCPSQFSLMFLVGLKAVCVLWFGVYCSVTVHQAYAVECFLQGSHICTNSLLSLSYTKGVWKSPIEYRFAYFSMYSHHFCFKYAKAVMYIQIWSSYIVWYLKSLFPSLTMLLPSSFNT